MEWQQTQTSSQHEVWSLIETFEAARRRLDFDQAELRSISLRTTVAVQTYYRVTLQRVDACIDILKNLHTELWRMNNLPLEPTHHWTTGDDGSSFDPTWEEMACAAVHVGGWRCKNSGPDNPTSQLLPIMSNKCCSGTGKEGKTKEVVKDREVKNRLCVTKWCVKDGV